ncbi:hypothetical protein MMC17_005008 [Xylographa soralifera]|nr:hypothetical protein [Xylographa soralifera]
MASNYITELPVERHLVKKAATFFSFSYSRLSKARNKMIKLKRLKELDKYIHWLDPMWGVRYDQHKDSKKKPTLYFKCLLVLEDLATAREFFQAISKDVLMCLERISITTKQSIMVYKPQEALQILQQISNYNPPGRISDAAFTVRKMNSYAWDCSTFDIQQSNSERFEPGFREVHLVLTVRLDVPGSKMFDVYDMTAWLRKRDSLISIGPGPQVNFLKRLPPELRDLIYGIVALPGGAKFTIYKSRKKHIVCRFIKQDFINLLLVNRQMSAEIKDFVSRTGLFSLRIKEDRTDTWSFIEDLAYFVRKMPAYIVSGIRDVEFISAFMRRSRTVLTYRSALMPLVNVIASNFGKVQEPYTLTPVFNLDEVALCHMYHLPEYWLTFTFVVDNIEPRIKVVLESTLEEADWPSLFSSIHPSDVCAKQCEKCYHELHYYYGRAVVNDWQSSPVLQKVVNSIVQSIKLNIEGYYSEVDEKYSLVKKRLWESIGWSGQMESGYYPMARFRPRPRKEVATVPWWLRTVARSYPHNWGPWSKTVSEPAESDSDRTSLSNFADNC